MILTSLSPETTGWRGVFVGDLRGKALVEHAFLEGLAILDTERPAQVAVLPAEERAEIVARTVAELTAEPVPGYTLAGGFREVTDHEFGESARAFVRFNGNLLVGLAIVSAAHGDEVVMNLENMPRGNTASMATKLEGPAWFGNAGAVFITPYRATKLNAA